MTVDTYTHHLDPVKLEQIVIEHDDIALEDTQDVEHDLDVEVDINLETMEPVAVRVFRCEFEDDDWTRTLIIETDASQDGPNGESA